MAKRTTTTATKPAQIDATTATTTKGRITPMNKKNAAATTTAPAVTTPKTVKAPKPTKEPRLRFCLTPETTIRFFDKALAKQVPVTITKANGVILPDVMPVAATESGYKFKGVRGEVKRDDIKRFEMYC